MGKRVIVIGGGVAGMQAAITLKHLGCQPMLIEKDIELGGKLTRWDKLFPSFADSNDVLSDMITNIATLNIKTILCSEVGGLKREGDVIEVATTDGNIYESEAIIIATGFELFDATLKQEYGYGIYDNVITSTDLEDMFKNKAVLTSKGEAPRSVAFLHCVGSRDEQVGQRHCSRVCCITGVKQAIEIRQLYPDCEVFNFYMDMRMFGSGYEELYRESQQTWNVNYIRGRISEASQSISGKIAIKAEDTLAARPLKMEVDMLVLLVGKKNGACNKQLASDLGLELKDSGFFKPKDNFTGSLSTKLDNVFVAGTAVSPKTVAEALNEGSAAAIKAFDYISKQL